VILGHVQRGGSPTPDDRILATRLGDFAVQSISKGATAMMVGEINHQCVLSPIKNSFTKRKELPRELIDLLDRMSS